MCSLSSCLYIDSLTDSLAIEKKLNESVYGPELCRVSLVFSSVLVDDPVCHEIARGTFVRALHHRQHL